MPSPTGNHSTDGYHPTATPPPIPGVTPNPTPTNTQTQPTNMGNNGLWFPPRSSTTVQTPPNMSPALLTNATQALTQIWTHVATNSNNRDMSKQILKTLRSLMAPTGPDV